MTPDVRSQQNSLLAALPRDEWSHWAGAIEPVEMPLGSVLYESGMQMKHVYFPVTSHRFAAACAGRRRDRGDCCRRQRRAGRHCGVHGRRDHAQPCRRANRWNGLSRERTIHQ